MVWKASVRLGSVSATRMRCLQLERIFVCRIFLPFVLAVKAAGCHGSETKIQKAAATESFDFLSASTGISYPVHVHLPSSYETDHKIFPVIYLTDAQWHFALVKEMIETLSCQVVLVGIEQGGSNRRRVDYLLPGASKFYRFLEHELQPAIEGRYRIDVSDRTIAGTSFGGLFVGISLLTDAQNGDRKRIFHNYWSFDGSFSRLKTGTGAKFLKGVAANQDFRGSLLLTGAGRRGNDQAVEAFKSHVAKDFPSLQIAKTRFDVDHDDVVIPSYTTALERFCARS